MIRPRERFELDVLVLNRSTATRRLELSVPPRPRRRLTVDKEESAGPGIVPLENHVRIGCVENSFHFFLIKNVDFFLFLIKIA